MKLYRICLIGMLMCALGWLTTARLYAQTQVTASPSGLLVAGVRGEEQTRTVLLHATGPITALQVIPLDLVRSDGLATLPASALQVSLTVDAITETGVLKIPILIDLAGAPSGEFGGQLWINYYSGSLGVPVTARVKDPWVLPFVVLLIGVIMGMALSLYRTKGRPRDEVLVRAGQVRVRIRADNELQTARAKAFNARIEGYLFDVESALQVESWQDARNAVQQAEVTWAKWFKGRDDWLKQLEYQEKLLQEIDKAALNPEGRYVTTVRRALEDAAAGAPSLDGPSNLRDQLDPLSLQINDYLELKALYESLNDLRNQLQPFQPDTAEEWQLKIFHWQQQIDALAPTDQEGRDRMKAELETALTDLRAILEQARQPAAGAESAGGAQSIEIRLPLTPPAVASAPDAGKSAEWRLKVFTWATYVVALVLLAGAGFNELYVTQSTFGANGWGDYFALLAWGFGAEATRAAVTELVRGWGVVGTA